LPIPGHLIIDRTRDDRYEVGVYIEKGKYARFVAKGLVAYEREGVSQVAKTMPAAPNFDLAAKAGHSWALERIPAIYDFRPGGSRDYAAQGTLVREGGDVADYSMT